MYNAMEFANETLLGSGCRRDVYLYDENSVLKVDTESYSGYKSSVSEITVWNMVKDTPDAKHFAAILEYTDDGWIRMERVERIYRYEGGSGKEAYFLLNKIADKYNVSDMHGGNIGQRADGTWCIIDYGAHLPTYNLRNTVQLSPNDPDRPCSCWECNHESEEYSEPYESPTCYLSCCNVRDENGLISLPY